MQKFIALILSSLILISINTAQAAVTPLSVSIIPPVQFPSNDFTISGLRMSVLWGHHRNVYGLDVGMLGNITDQEFTGIGISGLFNITHGTTRAIGLQFAGLTNINTSKTSVYGLQLAGAVNYNPADSAIYGLQAALLANISPFTDIHGVQLGLYNRAKEVYGFQLGLVNIADSLHGLQIGLINFNHKGTVGVCPILNAGF